LQSGCDLGKLAKGYCQKSSY